MEADGNELNDDLLTKIQACSDKDRDDDLVHNNFPLPCRLIAIKMVILHRRKKRNFDCEQPEEQCSWNLEGLAEVPPFLATVGEKT